MSTLRANTLKPITSGNSLVLQGDSGGSGVSGPSIDSNGDVDFSQNTNAKVKLPSGGGIYESDGSTEILTESSGTVTLKNTVIDGTVSMASSGLTLRNQEYKQVTAVSKSGTGVGGATTEFTVGTFTYTPKFGNLSGGSKIVFEAQFFLEVDNAGGSDARGYFEFDFSGSSISSFIFNDDNDKNFGGFDRGASGVQFNQIFRAQTAFLSASTNDTITSIVKARMTAGAGTPFFYLYSRQAGNFKQSYVKFMEFK